MSHLRKSRWMHITATGNSITISTYITDFVKPNDRRSWKIGTFIDCIDLFLRLISVSVLTASVFGKNIDNRKYSSVVRTGRLD